MELRSFIVGDDVLWLSKRMTQQFSIITSRIELHVCMFTIPMERQYHLLMDCRVSGGLRYSSDLPQRRLKFAAIIIRCKINFMRYVYIPFYFI